MNDYLTNYSKKAIEQTSGTKEREEKKREGIVVANTTAVGDDKFNDSNAFILTNYQAEADMLEERKKRKRDITKLDISAVKFRDIFMIETEKPKKTNEPLISKEENKTDEQQLIDCLLEDFIEYGQNIEDMDRFNKRAYNVSDSDEESDSEMHTHANELNFPSVNVYHDIGPLSRELLKIRDEKALRKKISSSYMQSYWNKLDTRYLSEENLVGCIGNKIPVTPLLYALKLNQERPTRIKSDVDYSQTSESEDNETEEAIEGTLSQLQNTQVQYAQPQTSFQGHEYTVKKVPSKTGEIFEVAFEDEPKQAQATNHKSQATTQQNKNYVISEEVEFVGEENVIENDHIPVSGANPLPQIRSTGKLEVNKKHEMNQPSPNKTQYIELNEEVQEEGKHY